MKQARWFLFWLAAAAVAQTHEVAFTLGGVRSGTRGVATVESGRALQANYAHRLHRKGMVALYGEVHLLSIPLRDVASSNQTVTRDVATLYLTPGLRLKLLPGKRIRPYGVIGAGYALYEQSLGRLDGAPNPATRLIHRGALQYGGGADLSIWRWLALRGEVRDFYTGNPSLNVPVRGGWHNVVVSGGLVLRLGREP